MTEVKCFECGKSFINTSEDGEVVHFEGYSRLEPGYINISLPICSNCIRGVGSKK